MKYAYDLHIHSVLSPCADLLMTPNNILNMATLKGLDIIAVTDHNSLKQLPVVDEIAKSYSFLLVYGVEVNVKEGIHVLCYFKTLEEAMRFDGELEKHLDKTAAPDVRIGSARLTDQEDFIIGELPYSLSCPADLSLPGLCDLLENYDHLRFFAHVDRPGSGRFFHARKVSVNGIELSMNAPEGFLENHGWKNLPVLRNSDAHQLMDIRERTADNVLELDSLDVDTLFRAFRK
jgi:hypothetical protein